MTLTLRSVDQEYCRAVMHERGPTYATAARFFPKRVGDRVVILYAFLREPDDIVDELTDLPLKRTKIKRWREDWQLAWAHPDHSLSPVLRSAAILFPQYGITWDETEAFLDAMEADLEPIMLPTLSELQQYMYGSAGVVGRMMVKLLLPATTWRQPDVLAKAALLGDAMQLTNFLRDTEEDFELRQRIYLPSDIMNKYQIDLSYWEEKKIDDHWRAAVQETVRLTQQWFDNSEPALIVFPWYLRWPIQYACRLYRTYLRQIENYDYNYWGKSISLSKLQKLKHLLAL